MLQTIELSQPLQDCAGTLYFALESKKVVKFDKNNKRFHFKKYLLKFLILKKLNWVLDCC
jgi:hypothetical protein